jgi:hypothetical protein
MYNPGLSLTAINSIVTCNVPQARLKIEPMLQGCALNVIYSNVPDEIQNGIHKAGERTKESTGNEIRNRVTVPLDSADHWSDKAVDTKKT